MSGVLILAFLFFLGIILRKKPAIKEFHFPAHHTTNEKQERKHKNSVHITSQSIICTVSANHYLSDFSLFDIPFSVKSLRTLTNS